MINYVYQLVSPHVFSLKYEDIDLKKEVIIRPRYMAVCHADQRYFLGQRDAKVLRSKLPMALIHECCGQVVWDGTGTYEKGQKVVLIPNVPGKDDGFIYENYAEGSRFLSSGCDGFMREYINLAPDRVVPFNHIPLSVAAITEFVSVAVHAANRFQKVAHARRRNIGVWGDGSLAYVVCCVLRRMLPDSRIFVVGKHERKLLQFSFVDETFLFDNLPADFHIDHAFECTGSEGSSYAIDDIITAIRPQGTVMLMGVSENRVPVRTRDILEKGLTFIGCSRSGAEDFAKAVKLMEQPQFQKRLNAIIYEDRPVHTMTDISRVFETDLNTPFKTVFRWEI